MRKTANTPNRETRIVAHVEEALTGQVARSFACRDSKGRSLGAVAYLGTYTYSDKGDRTCGHYAEPEWIGTTRYTFRPQAMRGDQPFGAYHAPQTFTTEAERDAAVEKYLKAAEKRAANIR